MARRSTEVRSSAPPLLTALVAAPGRVVVRLTGDADVSTAPAIRDVLAEAAASDEPLVVVDVAATRFWDVSGLRELAACSAALAEHGRGCRLTGVSRSTRRLISLADFAGSLRLDGPLPAGEPAVEPPAEMPEPPPPGRTAEAPRTRRRWFRFLPRRADDRLPSPAVPRAH